MNARSWLIASLLLLAAPASAGASILSSDEHQVRFVAGPGELNSVSFSLQLQLGYTLQDIGGAPMTQLAPCTPWDLQGGLGAGGICPHEGVERVVASLGDDADSWFSEQGYMPVPVSVFGDEGNDRLGGTRFGDTLVGGPGEDELFPGEGDDTIDVRDGERDVVHCGAGDDKVSKDAQDVLDPDCEQPVPPDGGQPPPGQSFTAYANWRKGFRLQRVLRGGMPLVVECSRACDVQARLSLAGKARHKGRRRVVAHLGTTVGAGEHVVHARFSRGARRLLRRYGAVALRLELTARPSGHAGGAAKRFRGRVQLLN